MEQERHSPTWALLGVAQGNTSTGSGLDALLQSTALKRGCTSVRARAGRGPLGGDDRRCELAGTSLVVVDALPSAGTPLLADDDCHVERARERRWWPDMNGPASSRGQTAARRRGAGQRERGHTAHAPAQRQWRGHLVARRR
jgi:hypothetical protein